MVWRFAELYCHWSLHNQLSYNFSGVHGFLILTVGAKIFKGKYMYSKLEFTGGTQTN